MQSIVDASTAVCEPTRTKRVASPAPPSLGACDVESHHPHPQHGPLCPVDQTCSCKRQRTSSQFSSPNAQNSSVSTRIPSITWHDTQNEESKVTEETRKLNHEVTNLQDATSIMMAMAATALKSTQDSSLGNEYTASASDERIRDLGNHIEDDETLKALKNIKRSLRAADVSERESMNQLQEQISARMPFQTEEMDAFTEHRTEVNESRSATGSGLVGSQQRSLNQCSTGNSRIHNFYTKASILSPRGILDFLQVQVDERSSFNLLPWSIAKDLHLIRYSDRVSTITVADRLIHTNQYCRLTIRVACVDTTINAMVIPGLQIVLLGKEWIQSVCLLSGFDKQSYYIPVPLAVEDAEERLPYIRNADVESEECDNVSCRNDSSSNSELSSSRLPSDDERSLDGTPSGDELLSDDGLLSNGEVSSGEELLFDEHELTPIDENDEGDEDDEDYGSYESEEFEDCENYEDCEDYEDCEGCEGCEVGEDDTDANLQGFMKQHKHHEYYAEVQPAKAAHEIAKIEPEPKLHRLTSFAGLKKPMDRNNESVGHPAFNMSSQQSGPKREQAFPNFRHVDNLDQSAAPNSTNPQMDGVQTPFTKLQAKEIANTLNNISRSPAGQSFKAPVEQLWPECAEIYAAKVPCPIDLGTMEMKVKSNIYHCLDEFRADAVLLYENSLAFNGINHIITSAALEVRDTILQVISDIEEGKGSTTLRASIRKP